MKNIKYEMLNSSSEKSIFMPAPGNRGTQHVVAVGRVLPMQTVMEKRIALSYEWNSVGRREEELLHG